MNSFFITLKAIMCFRLLFVIIMCGTVNCYNCYNGYNCYNRYIIKAGEETVDFFPVSLL